MAALRKTPTVLNGGPSNGSLYASAVDVEVEALWQLAPQWLTTVAGTNTITATSDTSFVAAITAYSRPNAFWLVPANTNTSSVTINIDAIGAIAIVDRDGSALISGALTAARLHLIIFDGTSFRLFTTGLPTILPTPAPDVILQEQQAQNTAAGGFTSAAWQTRALNTSVRNVLAGSSFAANALTLPAGTYVASWSAPAFSVDAHKTRLFNVTDSSVIALGTSEFTANSSAIAQTRSIGDTVFTLSTSKAIRIEHFCGTTRATNGLGLPSNFSGAVEIYAWLNVNRVA
jgi:hypothetical protein